MEISEKFLQHVWKHKLVSTSTFTSIQNQTIEIINNGTHNLDAGPDFFNGQIKCQNLLLVGNIEIHVKTSDWIKHKHTHDKAYDNVILHVVYTNDLDIENQPIANVPVIELKQFLSNDLIRQYQLFSNHASSLVCGKQIKIVPKSITDSWLYKLYNEKLETKLIEIKQVYLHNQLNLQETFYQILAGNFGFKVNKEPFIQLARKMPLSIISKHKNNLMQIEALLFGQAGFLEGELNHPYYRSLQNEFEFLRYKYNLKPLNKSIWKYLRLRPANFPSIRIAQLSKLLFQSEDLFSNFLSLGNQEACNRYFNISASPYWFHHYQFSNNISDSQPNLGKDSIDNICINTVIPMLFFYGREKVAPKYEEKARQMLEQIKSEKNKHTKIFSRFGLCAENAFESQALLQLNKQYCIQKKCLNCAIGQRVLKN